MRFLFSFLTVIACAASAYANDPLSEVNAKRASRGLRPFVADQGLTIAAQGAANFRAANLLFGHTSNDFSFVPAGSSAASAGCAAYQSSYGWLSCCTYESYTYAGAAFAMGADGKRYMHLFVSNTPSAISVVLADDPKAAAAPSVVVAPVAVAVAPQYHVEHRGLFGRRSVIVSNTVSSSVTTNSTVTTTATTTASVSSGACATGSCGVGTTFRSRSVLRVR